MGICDRERESQIISNISSICPFPPKAIKLEVSSLCNFKCRICYNRKQTGCGMLSEQDFEIALKEIIKTGTKQVGVLFLGESTLNPLLPYFIRRLKESLIDYVFLTTNGLLVKDDMMKALLLSGLDSLKWSVNYNSVDDFVVQTGSEKQNFQVILDNIKNGFNLRNSLESSCKLYASVVVKDINDIDPRTKTFIDHSVRPYVDEIVYNEQTNHGGLDDGRCCSNVKDSIPCPRLFNNIYIRSNLDVVLCCNGFTDEFKIGNIRDISLYDIWNSKKMQELRTRHICHDVSDTICTKERLNP